MILIKKRKLKWKNIILIIGFIISLILIIVSVTELIKWKTDNKQIKDISDNIIEDTPIKEIDGEVVNQNDNIPKDNPYWNYIKMNLIEVDFKDLKKKNNETVGWIQVKGTNINYPFVQTKDNDYYLKHSFDKSYNNAGWVFLDYRNNIQTLNKNTILYAHGRNDKTMFGSLRNILTSGWLNNTNNHVIKLSTEYEDTLWQVFSVYRIPTTNDYIRVDFKNTYNFLEFANTLKNRSAYNFNTTLQENDNILTLSTCYNDSDKVVLHAKLIKKSAR